MNSRTLRVTGLCLASVAIGAAWAGSTFEPGTAFAVVSLVAGPLALLLWMGERHKRAVAEAELEHERARLREISDTRWRTALVDQVVARVTGELGGVSEHKLEGGGSEPLRGLLRLAHGLLSVREYGVALELATSVGAPLVGCRASVILVERDGGFEVGAAWGFEDEPSQSWLAAIQAELENAVRTRGPILIHPRSPSGWAVTRGLGSFAAVPLSYGRELMGVFLFERSDPDRPWTDADLELVGTLGELTAAALKSARRFEELSAKVSLADLYDNAPDLHQTLDGNGRILDCNLTQCQTLGYTKEELVGTRFDSILSQGSRAAWARFERELIEKGRLRDVPLELATREGELVEVHVSGSLLAAASKESRVAQIVMRDRTEVRRLEQQLLQSQKLEMVGALAGGIAHDFNNVLSGILGYASLLRAQLPDRPLAKRYAETIERSAVRGAELAGRILNASRRAPVKKEPVDVNRVVEETIELLEHTFHKRVRIEKKLDLALGAVVADPSQIQQVVLNLCVNARDAMPEGGRLVLETAPSGDGETLCLTVEDTGAGIDPETIQRLFEPFFSTKGDEGSGLGLSVVYGIVKSLGGDVRVRSAPEQGARFDILLPMQPSQAMPAEPSPLAGPVEGHGELILLVDDESVLRELGKEILEGHGYRVETVPSGEAALSFFRESKDSVALVILDVVMPGLDGNETYRRLRRLDAGVPVLLSSGLTAEEAVQVPASESASGFIPKPYGVGELTRAVSQALRRVHRPPLLH